MTSPPPPPPPVEDDDGDSDWVSDYRRREASPLRVGPAAFGHERVDRWDRAAAAPQATVVAEGGGLRRGDGDSTLRSTPVAPSARTPSMLSSASAAAATPRAVEADAEAARRVGAAVLSPSNKTAEAATTTHETQSKRVSPPREHAAATVMPLSTASIQPMSPKPSAAVEYSSALVAAGRVAADRAPALEAPPYRSDGRSSESERALGVRLNALTLELDELDLRCQDLVEALLRAQRDAEFGEAAHGPAGRAQLAELRAAVETELAHCHERRALLQRGLAELRRAAGRAD